MAGAFRPDAAIGKQLTDVAAAQEYGFNSIADGCLADKKRSAFVTPGHFAFDLDRLQRYLRRQFRKTFLI